MNSASFDGFPAGELQYISVPDLFFTGLTPAVDNLAELKVILHVIWLRQRRGKQVLTGAELSADETLALSLGAAGGSPPFSALRPPRGQGGSDLELVLRDALDRAVARGALLRATVDTPSGQHDIYALNSEGGRRAFEEVHQGRMGIVRVVVADRPATEPRPNIFELYEDNIGLISPLLADELRQAEATYPPDWIEDALRIAVENNVRKWRYVAAILEGWATRGKDERTAGRKAETEKRWYTDDEFKQFFKH